MSLILEALKKAEREHGAGGPPAVQVPPRPAGMPRSASPRLRSAAGAAAVVLVAAGLFFWSRATRPVRSPVDPAPRTAAEGIAQRAPAPVVPAEPLAEQKTASPPVPPAAAPRAPTLEPPAAAAKPVPRQEAPAGTAPVPAAALEAPAAEPSPAGAKPAPRQEAPARTAPVPAARSEAPPPSSTPTPASPPAPKAAAPALPLHAAPPPAAPAAAVPEHPAAAVENQAAAVLRLREAFDGLEVSAHVFAEDPSQRFVFLDGRVYREGDRVAPEGFRVEQITPEGLTIEREGVRIRVPVGR